MTLKDIYTKFKNGSRVRRSAWDESILYAEVITYEPTNTKMLKFVEDNSEYSNSMMSVEDVLANDWEIIE